MRAPLKASLMIIANTFKTDAIYWKNTIVTVIGACIGVMAKIMLWRALYAGSAALVAGRTLTDLMTYTLLITLIKTLNRADFASNIDEKVKSGALGIDLIRPLPTRIIHISENIGSMAGKALFIMLPAFIFGLALTRGITAPASGANFILFLISLFMGVILMYMIETLIGALAIWYISPDGIAWVVGFLINVFGGALVPLWFLPSWMQAAARCLPFQAAMFVPVEIYLGTIAFGDAALSLSVQAGWIAAVFAVQHVIWKNGLRRVSILGG